MHPQVIQPNDALRYNFADGNVFKKARLRFEKFSQLRWPELREPRLGQLLGAPTIDPMRLSSLWRRQPEPLLDISNSFPFGVVNYHLLSVAQSLRFSRYEDIGDYSHK